ncbi:methyltransferase domain-containing protein [Trypanosoma grayi]|uniref:methyltransferase domain-containing protein n=1 Tax=Trypanosoma grayi TaxID=71804 RepID=UPI0004F45CA9|nr:methyltransferase domain-containing protein [Trypanosoma grayi]KEG14517.1 methyltransferase domain-containing protein [Trypanosoma grayi]
MNSQPELGKKALRTRGGGSFADPDAIQLHGNDFSWSEKMEELSNDERQVVEEYLQNCEQKLARLNGESAIASVITSSCGGSFWDSHYQMNRRHFPLKNYIILAFPLLKTVCSSQKQGELRYVVECGCGTGSTLLPLMRQFKEDVHFVGFDVSASAVSIFMEHPVAKEFAEQERLSAFAYDITVSHERSTDEPEKTRSRTECGGLRSALLKRAPGCGRGVDAVILVFVLSSLTTLESMVFALKQLASVMKKDSVLLFRDYAVPDHNLFRFVKQNNGKVNELSFCKGDGTFQMFFELGFTKRLFALAGFEEVDGHGLQYHCNRLVNRKNGKKMDKVFINGSFRLSMNSDSK